MKTIYLKDLLGDIKMSLLSFCFVMIYIIHKMLKLLKITQITLYQITFPNAFLRSIIDFFFLNIYFFTTYNDGKFKS